MTAVLPCCFNKDDPLKGELSNFKIQDDISVRISDKVIQIVKGVNPISFRCFMLGGKNVIHISDQQNSHELIDRESQKLHKISLGTFTIIFKDEDDLEQQLESIKMQ